MPGVGRQDRHTEQLTVRPMEHRSAVVDLRCSARVFLSLMPQPSGWLRLAGRFARAVRTRGRVRYAWRQMRSSCSAADFTASAYVPATGLEPVIGGV
jgi:hypothetical protein